MKTPMMSHQPPFYLGKTTAMGSRLDNGQQQPPYIYNKEMLVS